MIWSHSSCQVRDAVPERQVEVDLDEANQIAAVTTAMAVEEILLGVDVKRGLGFRVEQTQSNIFVSANPRDGRSS